MSRNRSSNSSINILKTLKDYTIPFIGFLLIGVLLYSVFSSPNTNNDINNNETIVEYSDLQVNLSSLEDIVYIVYDSGKKVKIEESISLGKMEKVVVESGTAIINFSSIAKMKLSENGEFSYKEDGSFYLESGDLWVEAMKDIDIYMKYANASLSLGSISNLNQNEIESSVYSIYGNVSVSNLAGVSSNIKNSYKININSIASTSTDIDLSSMEANIDDYFKLSSWFKSNGGEELLKNNSEEKSSSLSGSLLIKKDTTPLLIFDDVIDESYVNSNPIDLKGRYSPLKVGEITINGKKVTLNKDLGIFSLKGLILSNSTNDLVIKIFDNNKNIIGKRVFTIYSSNPILGKSNSVTTSSKSLENYSIRPTDFLIYEPTKTGKIITTNSRITIRGKVINKNVASVSVNDYILKSYNGSTWRYHAFIEQETLKDGANNYEIKYMDKAGNILYKEYYSIFKEKPKAINSEIEPKEENSANQNIKETKLISSETKVN